MRAVDADELKKCAIPCEIHNGALTDLCVPLYQIDNAPPVNDCPNCEYKLEADYIRSSSSYKELIDLRKFKETNTRPQCEWESVGFVNMKYAWFRCSNCHKTTKIYQDSNNDFCCIADIRKKAIACLYCGAKMKGGVE